MRRTASRSPSRRRVTLTLLAWTVSGWAALASASQAQVIGSTTISSDNPIQYISHILIGGANEAGGPFNPACSTIPQPTQCANNAVTVRLPVGRQVTTSIPTRRAELVLTKTNGVESAVPGESVTYTITVENRPATLGRLFALAADFPVLTATLLELDPLDGTIFSAVPSPAEITLEDSVGLATTGTSLLAAGTRTGPIYEFDLETGATLREIPNPSIEIEALAYRDGEIFAVDQAHESARFRVVVLDYATGEVRRVLGTYAEDFTFSLGGGLAATNDTLVGTSPGNQNLVFGIDPINRRAEPFEVIDDDGNDLNGGDGAGAIDNEIFIAPMSSEPIRVYEDFNGVAVRLLSVSPLDALGADHFEQRQSVTGATVTDTFAPELSCTWTCVPSGDATCTAGPVAGDIADTVDIPLGESVIYTAVCAVSPSAVGTLSNTATVDAGDDLFEIDEANNVATDIDTLVATSDLAITKTDDRDPIGAGATLTYTVTVDNPGPSDATSVVVTETLPAEVTLVATSGCDNDPAGAPSCALGTIPAGGSASFDVDVLVDPDVASASLLNEVSVASASEDDNLANNVASETTEVDTTAPTVAAVGSIADTGDGALDECEEARVDITQLLATFSKPVFDPVGDTDPADVTNPGNYRLVAAGPDGDFDTATCGAAAGDDLLITIDAATYEAAAQTATLALNAGEPLTDSLYRLLVCSGPGIEDLVGNALDGDGDGIVGGDFVRTYRVERDNLFHNGQFDCDLEPWIAVSTDPSEISHALDDVQDSSVSGSAAFTNLTASLAFSIGQCLDLLGRTSYALSGSVRVDAADDALLLLSRQCEFFSESGCIGEPIGSELTFDNLSDTDGAWTPRASVVSSPTGTRSALCSFDISAPGGDDFEVFLDQLELTIEAIFADGFESGDTSAWSITVP